MRLSRRTIAIPKASAPTPSRPHLTPRTSSAAIPTPSPKASRYLPSRSPASTCRHGTRWHASRARARYLRGPWRRASRRYGPCRRRSPRPARLRRVSTTRTLRYLCNPLGSGSESDFSSACPTRGPSATIQQCERKGRPEEGGQVKEEEVAGRSAGRQGVRVL